MILGFLNLVAAVVVVQLVVVQPVVVQLVVQLVVVVRSLNVENGQPHALPSEQTQVRTISYRPDLLTRKRPRTVSIRLPCD